MRRFLIGLAGAAVFMLGLSPATLADARHAGASSTDPTDKYNVGVRSTISSIPVPQYTVDGANQFFWPGENLADGSFYQVGASVNYQFCGNTCFTYFAWAFDAHKNPVLEWPGPGNHFGTNARHTYAFQNQRINGSIVDWYMVIDGTRWNNTDFYTSAGNSGTNIPYETSETSLGGSTMPDAGDAMGPALYNGPALQTRYCGSTCAWYDTYHAQVYYANPYCPPINVVGWGYQSFSSGTNLTGYSCSGQGAALW